MMGIGFTAINMMFADYFIRESDMTFTWMSYLRYGSVLGYTFEGVSQGELRDREFPCPSENDTATFVEMLENDELISGTRFPPSALGVLLAPTAGAGCQNVSGNGILDFFGHSRDFLQTAVILGMFWAGFQVLTYLALVGLSKMGRRR